MFEYDCIIYKGIRSIVHMIFLFLNHWPSSVIWLRQSNITCLEGSSKWGVVRWLTIRFVIFCRLLGRVYAVSCKADWIRKYCLVYAFVTHKIYITRINLKLCRNFYPNAKLAKQILPPLNIGAKVFVVETLKTHI